MPARSRRPRARLRPEVRGVYARYEQDGAAALLTAMERAAPTGDCTAAARRALLAAPPALALAPLALPGLPRQAEGDRPLAVYEALVLVDVAAGTAAPVAEVA